MTAHPRTRIPLVGQDRQVQDLQAQNHATGNSRVPGSRRSDYVADPDGEIVSTVCVAVDMPSTQQIRATVCKEHLKCGDIGSSDPFIDLTKCASPAKFGVIKISRIPYNSTKQEILTFIGSGAQILNNETQGCAIHIIMDRTTSKTLDCFVEFKTVKGAQDHYDDRWSIITKHLKVGNRTVYVDLSTQDDLLKELFPRAQCIFWKGGQPIHVGQSSHPFLIGFQAFVTKEELYLMAKQAEHPQRFQFSEKSLQRTYECMISTLYKFPWHARKLYTVLQRNQIFDTYMQQLVTLVENVYFKRHIALTRRLLHEFLEAGFTCPGFGERQKFAIMVHSRTRSAIGRVNQFCEIWPFDVLLRKKDATDVDVMMYMKCIETAWSSLSTAGQSLVLRDFYTVDMAQLAYQPETPMDPIHDLHFRNDDNTKVGQVMPFEFAARYESELCRVLLKIGSEVIKTRLDMTSGYMFDDDDVLAAFIDTMSISDDEEKEAADAGPSDLQGHTPVQRPTFARYHERTHSTASEDLINSGRSSISRSNRSVPTTPTRGPATLARNAQSAMNLESANDFSGFKVQPPTAPRAFLDGTAGSEGRYHRRLSSADTPRALTRTRSPFCQTNHARSTSVPSRGDFGAIGSGRSTPTRHVSPAASFVGLQRQGQSSSTSKLHSRNRLSIDQTIHEEKESSDSDHDGHLDGGAELFMKQTLSLGLPAVTFKDPFTGNKILGTDGKGQGRADFFE